MNKYRLALGLFMHKVAEELTAAARKRIKKKNFAIPSRADTKKEKARSGNYPIHDRTHAINALARVSQHGTPKEKAMVRKKVCAKYPSLPSCKKKSR